MMDLGSLLGGFYGITNHEFEKRIEVIAAKCREEGIEYSIHSIMDGSQIRFPWCDGDVACHSGTYESHDGMVESYQFPWDEDDVSVCSPHIMAERIVMYYKDRNTKLEDYPW